MLSQISRPRDPIETEETLSKPISRAGNTLQEYLDGDGSMTLQREDKFVSGAYKLVQRETSTNKDKTKSLMHEDLAKEWS